MGRDRFKAKPTGSRSFSTPEEMDAGFSSRRRTSKKVQEDVDEHNEEESEEESGDSEQETEKKKGIPDISEIHNPNLVKPKNVKAGAADDFGTSMQVGSTPELSLREREEIERNKAHERCMRLQEQGKTEQARKDFERLAMIRQQRAAAAKKREDDKAAKEQMKAEARK